MAVGDILSSFNTPNINPLGLAWDGANLWHADFGIDDIFELTITGVILSSFNTPDVSSRGLTWDGTNLWNSNNDPDKIFELEALPPPPAVAGRRPRISARRPLQQLAPEIVEERLTVFCKVILFKQELVSTRITNTIHLKLHQRESITALLQAPDQWLAKDHTSNAIKLVLKKKDKLFNTFNLKLRESPKPSQETQMRLRNAKALQNLRDSLKDKDKRIKSLADHILKLIAIKNLQADQLQELQTSLVKLKEGTMSADDVLALFASSD